MSKVMPVKETESETVVLAARVPPELKEKVEKFAKASMRTGSQAVHYLLENHPELKKQSEKIATDR